MSITADEKQGLIQDYRRHETDSGSPEVQIAVLTTRPIAGGVGESPLDHP